MPRAINYDEKIQTLAEKIAKKKAEIKKLEDEIQRLKHRKDNEAFVKLNDFIKGSDLQPDQVLAMLQNQQNQQPQQ